ncbi:MAG: hypothetical protein HOK90_05505 [Gemmatimonadetes bacterium]|nr:hypothetical protein [Gemmatimonadota bacterium]
MNRLLGRLLTLFFLAGSAHAQESFEINTKTQWETWDFPVGTLNIRDDGSIKPIRFEQPFNAAPSAPLFTHKLKAGEQRGGVWKAGSNAADANLIIDDDIGTHWQPDQDDGVDKWWLEIDLGRMVAVKEIRLHFPDEEGARPLRSFRVFGSDGKFQSITDDVFLFNLIGGTTKRNEETLVEYPVSFGEATKRVLSFGQANISADTTTAFAPTQYIRIIADAKSEDAALAEVEVIAFGQNIARETIERGGMLDDQGKERAPAMIDGNVNTFWEELNWSETGQFIAQWKWDLGATYWVNRVLFVAFQETTTWGRPRILSHRLLGSDGTLKPSGDTDFDVLFDFPPPNDWNNPEPITYLMQPYRPLRHLQMVFGGSSSGAMAEVVVIPTGYIAEVELRSDFIKIDDRPKVYRTLEWEADLPPGTQILAQTRSGSGLDEGNTYWHRKGYEITEDEYNALKKQWKGDVVPYLRPSQDWSGWSNTYLFSGQEFLSPSPRRYVQFRVLLQSDSPDVAPTLHGLRLNYTDSFLNGALGEVTPKEAHVGEPESFTYVLRPDFASGDRGFDRLRLDTPSQADLKSIGIRVNGAEIQPLSLELMPDSIIVQLPQVITRQAVEIDLRVNVFENPYLFNAFVGHTDEIDFWQQVDPAGRAATTVFLPEVPAASSLLDKVAISPRVITPNGDGVGDQTEIRFAVLKVDTPVEVNVYSLDGRLVRSLTGDRSADGFLVYPWDGANASGQRVPPGIYVVKIEVDAQADVQGLSQIINVAY